MERTIVELSNDGNLLFTRQRRTLTGGGNSKQRRARARWLQDAANIPEWRRVGRVIVRPGKPIPEPEDVYGITLYQTGTEEIAAIAQENETTAELYAARARNAAAAIEKQQAEFTLAPTPHVRIMFEVNGVVSYDYNAAHKLAADYEASE